MTKTDFTEIWHLIISILILGFCFSFRYWGGKYFDFDVGFSNFIFITFLVGFSVFIHEITHRLAAKKAQAEINYRTWWTGVLVAIILIFLTDGWFVFAAIGAVTIVPLRVYRVGTDKQSLGPFERAKIALSGPMANFVLAVISAILFNATGSFLWERLFAINAWIAVFNLFPFFRIMPLLSRIRWYRLLGQTQPIATGKRRTGQWISLIRKTPEWTAKKLKDERLLPRSEGEIVFFGSKPTGIFLFSFVTLACVLLFVIKNIFASLFLALIIGGVIYALWHYYVESWSYLAKKRKKPFQY